MREPVIRYLRSMGCRHFVAEDISQEVFLRLHRAMADGLRVKDVRAWVFRVARNLYIDSRREDHRYSSGSMDGVLSETAYAPAVSGPEQAMLERERIRTIQREISRLPDLQRECMHLRAEGLRYHEIASVLDIPMTAAVDCVRQALKRLRRRFQAELTS